MLPGDSPGPWASSEQLPAILSRGAPATPLVVANAVTPTYWATGPEGRTLTVGPPTHPSVGAALDVPSQSKATSCRNSQSERPGAFKGLRGPQLCLCRRSEVLLFALCVVSGVCTCSRAIRRHRPLGQYSNG